MYVNIIIYSNRLLLFVWLTSNKEKKKKICTSLRRLKLVGLNYVPMRRPNDVSSRSISFTYQSRRLDPYET